VSCLGGGFDCDLIAIFGGIEHRSGTGADGICDHSLGIFLSIIAAKLISWILGGYRQ
jgi:hypothetical protein